jgi:hypothetical protein
MPIIKPRNHLVTDIYKAWCAKKLKEDPSLSLVYDHRYRAHELRVLVSGRVKVSNRVVNEGVVVMSYLLFRTILEAYNKEAIKLIIEGEALELGNRMGYILAKRRGRNYNRKKINIHATKLARIEEPDHPPIYYTSEDYCMLSWKKPKSITNERVYSFIAAPTLKRAFKKALYENSLLKFTYPFTPYKPPLRQTA